MPRTRRKLGLHKDTVRMLEDEALTGVHGGAVRFEDSTSGPDTTPC